MKLRILMRITMFFPNATGATHSTFRLARTLRDKGCDVAFLVEEMGQGFKKGGVYDGFLVHSVSLNIVHLLRKGPGLLSLYRFLKKHANDYDVLHVMGGCYQNLFSASLAGRLTPMKTMLKITSDGWDSIDGVRKLKYGRLAERSYRKLDGVVSMVSGIEEKTRRLGYAGHTAVIPNGVDCDVFRPVEQSEKFEIRKQLNIPEDAFVLIYAGWFGGGKGTDVLMRVFDQLQQHYSNAYLLCVGNYVENLNGHASAEEFLEANDIDPMLLKHPRFMRTGRVEDVERYMQASDVFVFPSRREGFGTVQTEAMACGLPCVVNDLPGLSCDIYPDESVGFRVQDNDVDEYVRILEDLIADPEKRKAIGSAARKRVESEFSLDVVADKYIAFYQQLLAGD